MPQKSRNGGTTTTRPEQGGGTLTSGEGPLFGTLVIYDYGNYLILQKYDRTTSTYKRWRVRVSSVEEI
jgi:hypothetical protein